MIHGIHILKERAVDLIVPVTIANFADQARNVGLHRRSLAFEQLVQHWNYIDGRFVDCPLMRDIGEEFMHDLVANNLVINQQRTKQLGDVVCWSVRMLERVPVDCV